MAVSCRLPDVVPGVGVKVGAGVRNHRLVGIVQRLLLDGRRRDGLGHSAFLDLSRLICNRETDMKSVISVRGMRRPDLLLLLEQLLRLAGPVRTCPPV